MLGGGKKGGGKCLSLLLSKCESRAEHFECQHLKKQPKKGGLCDINIKLRIRSGIDRKMDIERKNEDNFYLTNDRSDLEESNLSK